MLFTIFTFTTRLNQNGKNGVMYYGKELVGMNIERGQQFSAVGRPGGIYSPESHFEVWRSDSGAYQLLTDSTGVIFSAPGQNYIDPLYLLSLPNPKRKKLEFLKADLGDIEKDAKIVPFIPGRDYSDFRGMTYPLTCRKVR